MFFPSILRGLLFWKPPAMLGMDESLSGRVISGEIKGDVGTKFSGGTQKTFPPGTSIFPVIPIRMRRALAFWKALTFISGPFPHSMQAGLVAA